MEKNKDLFIDRWPSSPLEIQPDHQDHIEMAFFETAPQGHLEIHVGKDATLDLCLADFSSTSSETSFEIVLEEGASAEVHVGVLGKVEARKHYVPNVIHHGSHSTALVSCHGIATGKSFVSFTGASAIEKGSKGSDTRQEAKVILFDRDSKGNASPILKIGENDIKASHGASVGRLNDLHLFYLESRGLSEEEAKRLITLGYLKPIAFRFQDESLKERLIEAIEGGILYA